MTDDAKPEQTAVNDSGTVSEIGLKLTHRLFPVRS